MNKASGLPVLRAVSGPPKHTDEPHAIVSASCPSARRPAHHRSSRSSLMPRLRSMRSNVSTSLPPMTMSRGLSFGSRGQKGVMARLGMRGKIQNNNHQWHATAQGVSHAAAKHPVRFRGLRVLHALYCAPQPNIAFQRTPTHPIASATPCGRL